MRGVKISLFVLGLLSYGAVAQAQEKLSESMQYLQKMSDGFAELAARVQPGIVAISTEGTVEVPSSTPFGFPGHPQREQREQRRDGIGSGVIVSFKGENYILTNNHVIRNADKIQVQLPDSRFFAAEVVGSDSLSDLALLKIEGDNLPTVELGDSDALREGEWVLAIGNPLGYSHSISTGIVSAQGRDRFGNEYGSYIQTDAAINPGNSGGALVNLRGELVGINSAIVSSGGGPFGSRRGGSVGIGFAIPVNQAKHVMGELIEYGEVRRGFLGVNINDLTPLVAEAMGLETTDGVLITRVIPGQAAAKGGVEESDIVLEIDGRKVRDLTELRSIIGRTAPGTKIELLVLRDDDKKRLRVKLESLTKEALASATPEHDETQASPNLLGLAVQDLTPNLARQLGYEDDEGVLVSRVRSGGEAERRGLQRGMLILAIGRRAIKSLGDYEEALEQIEPGQAFTVQVRYRNNKRLIGMRMPEK